MTMTKGTPDGSGSPTGGSTVANGCPVAPARPRRSHVPADGSPTSAAVEQARTTMLHEVKPRKRTRIGADVVCEALLRQGVDVLFSYPGGVILPLYDILGDYPEIRHILVRHEQGGAHAADGYARVTGRVGRVHGDLRPGRHEPRHRDRHGPARLDPDGRDHRQRPGGPHRQGRLPGDRHQRHHAADDQAQLPGPRRRRPAAGRRRGVPHRPDRPARPGPHRHHQGRPPAGDDRRASLRGRDRGRPAGLPPDIRGTSQAAQAGGRRDRSGQAAGDPGRPRRPPRRGLGRPAGLRREDQHPGRLDPARDRGHGRDASAGLRLHGHARLEARQPGDPVGRPADRHRDALRRPGHRQRPDLRAVCPDHPRRHRPGRDRQERRGRGPHRRRCRPGPARPDPDGRADRAGRACRLPRPAGRVEARFGGVELARLGRLARRPAVGRLRRRADRRADRPRGDLRRRRRPEPDVAGPLRRLPPAEQPRQLGRPRDDGLQRPGGDGRGARPARPGDLGDHRRRRLPDDLPGADDPGPGPHPGQDRPARQQEAGDDPPVAGDHLRRQLPLGHAARAGLPQAGRRLRHPRLQGPDARARSTTPSGPPRPSTGRRWSGSRSPRSRTSSR